VLAKNNFAMQSNQMNPNWAEENLQTIRTLMERSAVYRRALAPIMLFAGAVGVVAAMIGIIFHFNSPVAFTWLWPDTAMFAVVGAFLIARRQSIKDKEAFWSAPARRVGLAMFPTWLAGIMVTEVFRLVATNDSQLVWWLLPIWMVLYGLGLHGASFFMPRGIRIFGWVFFLSGLAILVILAVKSSSSDLPPFVYAHYLIGAFFGGGHLAYGVYLYLTEKKNPVA
jgi:hypothetical protein